MNNQTKINLETFAGGALAEKTNIELQKVMDNIFDPNTDATKARKVTITLTLKADEKREIIATNVDTKCTLVAAKGVATTMLLGTDTSGKVVGRELASGAPGQTYFTDDGQLRNDEGELLENEVPVVEDNVKKVKFQ
ncbi:replication terminator protein (plasmid) [Lysinibacillus capsici]|uniref:replication terminator protein n=1 Tax=Lysinibacillus capsici TaxID=2115968 RepID=UPI0021DA2792|nr:replication terminator protein [Lysinibacillus capsici]UYB50198.1 replication terminator protein [Lysinibacillus capsici]UYB50275.1 replication terminator protein [Lysinibacillus capsici]